MATFVLVHGGGHGGWCYQRVSRLLSKAGHEVYAPTMTGLGERSHLVGPHVDLNLHIQDIAAVLHYEDLRDVILVGHSYGGMVITGVAGLAPDRVGKLVYLDAANPRNGESLVDVAGPVLALARQAGRVVDGVELVQLPSPEAGTFYGVTEIPQYHIVCAATLATRDPVLMDEARASGRLWVIETGHDLMITEPEQVTDALVAVAAG
jgi:pimeloyl-ACP methyl ester carboxylesterase